MQTFLFLPLWFLKAYVDLMSKSFSQAIPGIDVPLGSFLIVWILGKDQVPKSKQKFGFKTLGTSR